MTIKMTAEMVPNLKAIKAEVESIKKEISSLTGVKFEKKGEWVEVERTNEVDTRIMLFAYSYAKEIAKTQNDKIKQARISGKYTNFFKDYFSFKCDDLTLIKQLRFLAEHMSCGISMTAVIVHEGQKGKITVKFTTFCDQNPKSISNVTTDELVTLRKKRIKKILGVKVFNNAYRQIYAPSYKWDDPLAIDIQTKLLQTHIKIAYLPRLKINIREDMIVSKMLMELQKRGAIKLIGKHKETASLLVINDEELQKVVCLSAEKKFKSDLQTLSAILEYLTLLGNRGFNKNITQKLKITYSLGEERADKICQVIDSIKQYFDKRDEKVQVHAEALKKKMEEKPCVLSVKDFYNISIVANAYTKLCCERLAILLGLDKSSIESPFKPKEEFSHNAADTWGIVKEGGVYRIFTETPVYTITMNDAHVKAKLKTLCVAKILGKRQSNELGLSSVKSLNACEQKLLNTISEKPVTKHGTTHIRSFSGTCAHGQLEKLTSSSEKPASATRGQKSLKRSFEKTLSTAHVKNCSSTSDLVQSNELKKNPKQTVSSARNKIFQTLCGGSNFPRSKRVDVQILNPIEFIKLNSKVGITSKHLSSACDSTTSSESFVREPNEHTSSSELLSTCDNISSSVSSTGGSSGDSGSNGKSSTSTSTSTSSASRYRFLFAPSNTSSSDSESPKVPKVDNKI